MKEAIVTKAAVDAGASPKDGEYQLLPRESIRPSATNPRKHFDPVKLEGLAKTIERLGIQMPLVVRLVTQEFTVHEPELLETQWTVLDRAGKVVKAGAEAAVKAFAQGKTEPYYELVAGERRWRAAGLVKLAKVPAMVRNLSDADVLEIQYIENLQRDDLTALEEAEGFAKLIEMKVYTADTLAEKLQMSRSHVYGRLALLKCGDAVRAALLAGKIETSVAVLVSTIPELEKQKELLEEISNEDNYRYPFSVRKVKEMIEQDYRTSLEDAPFDLKDAKLDAAAGPCTKCPKRTGNMTEVLGAVKDPNVCTNPSCYENKVKAQTEKLEEEARKNGQTVLTREEYQKNRQRLTILGSNCYETAPVDDEYPTYKELLGKHVPKQTLALVVIDGQVHEVVPTAEVERIIEEKKLIPPVEPSERDKQDAARLARREKVERVMQAALSDVILTASVKTSHVTVPMLRNVVRLALLKSSCAQMVWKTRETGIKDCPGETEQEQLEYYAFQKMDQSEENLWGLLVNALVAADRMDYNGEPPEEFTKACEIFGVDLKQVERWLDGKAESKPKAKAQKVKVKKAKAVKPAKKGKKKA